MDFATLDNIFDITGKGDIEFPRKQHKTKYTPCIYEIQDSSSHQKECDIIWSNMLGLGICCVLAIAFAWFITKYEERKG